MKFKVSADQLSSVAKIVTKGLNPKDTHSQSILKLNADNTKLLIYSTTQSTFFKGSVSVFDVIKEDNENTEWSVDGAQLKTILSVIPSTASIPVEFDLNSNARKFIIKVTNNTFKLPVFDTISPYEEEANTKISVINANDFINKISAVGRIVSTDADDIDNATSCLHINFDENEIRVMGTDNISIVEEKLSYNRENEVGSILIPVSQISLLTRTFDSTEDIALISTGTKFGYVDKTGIVSLVSKTNVSPIAYEQVLVACNEICKERTVTINSSDFRTATSALSKLAPNSEIITMKVNDNNLVLSNINEDIMIIEIIEKNFEDEDVIYFYKKPLQGIETLFSDKITLGWKSDEYGRFVKFTNYKVDENDNEIVDENVFIGANTNDE